MDWDDPPSEPLSRRSSAIGDDLSKLSIAELEARIKDLEGEIQRVEAELGRKKTHEQAASALFGGGSEG